MMERLSSYEPGMVSDIGYSHHQGYQPQHHQQQQGYVGSVSPDAGAVPAGPLQSMIKQEMGGVPGAPQPMIQQQHGMMQQCQQQPQQQMVHHQQQHQQMAHGGPMGHGMTHQHVVHNMAQSVPINVPPQGQHMGQHMGQHQGNYHAHMGHQGAFGMGIPGMPMGAPMMQVPTGRGGVIKYCGVCGDIAKSYHFGGLSCDSCKAFFRRSVQNDNYLHFQCCHGGQCVISLTNRKSCQYCRMKRCFEIGMEKSWVMTEEERKALMKARAEKKLSKQLAAAAAMASVATPGKTLQHSSSSSSLTKDEPGTLDYEPQVERMIDYLSPLEIKEIESIVTKYMHAYQHVPYRTELRYYDNDRPGFQVMEMFGTLIRRFAFYARMMADFTSLPSQDQRTLLKGGVLEMCLLRGALVFDPLNNRWPNTNMSLYKDTPVLRLGNISNLTSSRIFQMHMEFIGFIQQLGVDEPTIMLLILIVLFTERPGLLRPNWVEKYQAYYTSLLERYMGWRFGPPRAKHMFSKLLTKLSDLRELSDIHNQRNMRLGNDEISSIQQQLQHLKINPYPELKIVPEDNPVAGAVDQQAQQHQQQQGVMGHQQATGGSQVQYQQYPVSSNAPYLSAASGAQHANYAQQQDSLASISPAPVARQQSPHYSSPASNDAAAAASPGFVGQHQQYKSAAHGGSSSPIDAKPINALPQEHHQQQLDAPMPPAYGQAAHCTPNTPLSAQQGSPYDAGQHSVPSSSSGYSSNESQASVEVGSNAMPTHLTNPDVQQSPCAGQQTPPSMVDMGMQFMRAMHQSVTQVVDEPYFGFEWVKPDYQFDGLIDADELAEALGRTPEFNSAGSPLDDEADSPRSKSSRRSSGSGSDASVQHENPPTSNDTADADALTPKAMEELYDELEKYSELYCQ